MRRIASMSALEPVPNEGTPRPATDRPAASPARGTAFKVAAVALTVVSALAGTGLARWLKQPQLEPVPGTSAPTVNTAAPKAAPPQQLFAGWSTPDLALVLTAQMHGYLLPCGCSRPQVGGLERRYNFVQQLRQRGWPLALYDLGDVPQKKGPLMVYDIQQNLTKYRYAMKALQQIGYTAVGFGEYEAAQGGAMATVSEWALQAIPPRVLLANLNDPDKKFDTMLYPTQIDQVAGSKLKVGVTALVGPRVAGKIHDQDMQFGKSQPAVEAALKQMDRAGADVRVLLYHGSLTLKPRGWTKPEPIACAEAYPQFQVVLALNEEDEPSHEPVVVKHRDGRQTFVIGLGQKGKYVGVVGLYRTNNPRNPFTIRYQPVHMSEDFLTPKDKEQGHPIVQMMEDYTRELRKTDALKRTAGRGTHPLQVAVKGVTPEYVGSEKCKKCHEHAYDVWKKELPGGRSHSHAYETLVKAERPSNRQFDPECIVCHTIGFGYKTGFENAVKTPHLRDVGCESCHGPASEHVKAPLNKVWYDLMNPWRAPEKETKEAKAKRLGRIDQFCQKCHDVDNDVTWTNHGFERKWPLIEHHTPQ
jgi:2',3'-cyclic-nucleotide 2'-phosphodiesterase (5'-nucleotidase family)